MRIANVRALKALQDSESGLSGTIARQLEAALTDASVESPAPFSSQKAPRSGSRQSMSRVGGRESKGEASVRLALIHEFGDWFSGGEVAQEVLPFPDRRYRVDFALIRYRAYIEVLLTPIDILMQTQHVFAASMHTGMNLMAREL